MEKQELIEYLHKAIACIYKMSQVIEKLQAEKEKIQKENNFDMNGKYGVLTIDGEQIEVYLSSIQWSDIISTRKGSSTIRELTFIEKEAKPIKGMKEIIPNMGILKWG